MLPAQLRNNILSQLVIQEEHVRLAKEVTEHQPAEALSFAVHTGAGRGRGKPERPCVAIARRQGMNLQIVGTSLFALTVTSTAMIKIYNFYEIVGYPEGWSDKNKATGGVGRGRQQAGHGRGSARANATSRTIGASSTASVIHLFSPEQWKAIAGLIGNSQVSDNKLNGKFDKTSWIIDTGATHHVTGVLSWLFDTMVIKCPVGLPHGESVVAILKTVLYVPNLNCNLLSVS